jgi:hypothetical protein
MCWDLDTEFFLDENNFESDRSKLITIVKYEAKISFNENKVIFNWKLKFFTWKQIAWA